MGCGFQSHGLWVMGWCSGGDVGYTVVTWVVGVDREMWVWVGHAVVGWFGVVVVVDCSWWCCGGLWLLWPVGCVVVKREKHSYGEEGDNE